MSEVTEEAQVALPPLNPIARVILQGLYDDGSQLSKIRGFWHILQVKIYLFTNYDILDV